MKPKSAADELRMKARKFDKMMRKALSAPPPSNEPNPPRTKKSKKVTKKEG